MIEREIERAEADLARLKKRYTDANPDVRSTIAEINSLKTQRDELAR